VIDMPVMIQIRNVPDDVHRVLKERAAEEGMSLSAYLLRDISRAAERPSWEEFHRRLATLRRPLKLKESPAETIRKIRDGR
jgi:plasmid stability protein